MKSFPTDSRVGGGGIGLLSDDGARYFLLAGRAPNQNNFRARAYCASSRCGWKLFGYFFCRISYFFSFLLSLVDGSI